jgi:hypothetical protein
VLYIGGAVLRLYEFTKGSSGHAKLEIVAGNVGNILTAGVILAAVLAFMAADREHEAQVRPVAIIALVFAGIVVALAVYQVFDILTVHIPGVDASDAALPSILNNGDSIGARIAGVLPALGALVVAAVALIGAIRVGNLADMVRQHRDEDSAPFEWPPEVE